MKFLTKWYLALITLALLVTLRFYDPFLVEATRLTYFDSLQRSHEQIQSSDVLLVNIDEKAIKEYGQWSWSRDKFANLLDRTAEDSISVFTVIYSEEDRFGKDQVFADALARRATIISSAPTDQSIEGLGPHVGTATVGGNPFDYVNSWSGILPPVTILAEASSGVGVSSTIGDVDGTIRKLPMVVGANEQIYPSVALETIRVAAGDISYQMKVGEAGVEAVRIPKFEPIKTTADGSVYISYWNKFDSISAADITPENTAGKFLIWGVTAEGVANPVPTSVGSMYPHEVQANLLQTVLNGNTIVRPDYADFLELVIILFVGLLIILAVYKAPMKLVLPLVILIAGGFGYASYHYWKTEYLLLDASLPVLGMLVIFAHASFAKFLENFLLKQQIKKQFGTYLSPAMVEKLQENPDLLQLGGESRELSIMFTDVRGFTTISEHYGKDVQGLTKIMNRYMTAMTQKIIENEGTLDKYIGDAQMAFWNAPLDDAEHAKNALRTGLAMLGDLEKFNEEISKEGIPAFGMGLGINTDVVVVGNMGSVQRFDYTCLGDGVNLAARLEGQSKSYGVKLIIGPKTAEYVEDEFPIIELDYIAVKGKTEGVHIFTVVPDDRAGINKHKLFLEYYYNQEFKHAISTAEQLKFHFDGKMAEYYDIMIERISGMKRKDGWDGIYRATSK